MLIINIPASVSAGLRLTSMGQPEVCDQDVNVVLEDVPERTLAVVHFDHVVSGALQDLRHRVPVLDIIFDKQNRWTFSNHVNGNLLGTRPMAFVRLEMH